MLGTLLLLIVATAASPARCWSSHRRCSIGGGAGLARVAAGAWPWPRCGARSRYASSQDSTTGSRSSPSIPAWRLPRALAPLALLDTRTAPAAGCAWCWAGRHRDDGPRRCGSSRLDLAGQPAGPGTAVDPGGWAGWLASLGFPPRGAARRRVTIDTSPGTRLCDAGGLGGRRAEPGRAADRPADHRPAGGCPPGRRRRRGRPGRRHLRPAPAASPSVPARLTSPPPRPARRCTAWSRRSGTCGSPCSARLPSRGASRHRPHRLRSCGQGRGQPAAGAATAARSRA